MNRKQAWKRWLLRVVSLLSLAGIGCGPVLSDAVRQQADPPVSFVELRENPEAYKDRMIILGGAILSGANLRDRNEDKITYLEVLQYPLGRSHKPSVTNNTEGPFLLRCNADLDLSVYAKGRLITVAGRVAGAHTAKFGEIAHTYPLLTCQELHLWAHTPFSPELYAPDPWWYGAPWLSEEYWDYP